MPLGYLEHQTQLPQKLLRWPRLSSSLLLPGPSRAHSLLRGDLSVPGSPVPARAATKCPPASGSAPGWICALVPSPFLLLPPLVPWMRAASPPPAPAQPDRGQRWHRADGQAAPAGAALRASPAQGRGWALESSSSPCSCSKPFFCCVSQSQISLCCVIHV